MTDSKREDKSLNSPDLLEQKTYPDLKACPDCDTVYTKISLKHGQIARCVHCGATLYRAQMLSTDGWLAFSIAAAAAFAIANFSPAVSVGFQGQYNSATPWDAVQSLAVGPIALIAIPTALAALIIPMLQIVLLIWILCYARLAKQAPGFNAILRFLIRLRPWSMVEVSLLATLVTIVKLTGYLDIHPKPGILALAALMLLITFISNHGLHHLWEVTDHLPQATPLSFDTSPVHD